MAHEISQNRITGRNEMAFTGETPWHGLGQSVTKGAPLETWIKEAGFDWHAQERPLYFKHRGEVLAQTDLGKIITRSDTNDELAIVGQDYNVVQPREIMEFFRDLTEEHGWHIQTAGVLRGGRKLWVMAGRDDLNCQVVKGDPISGRLLLATSLDGSMKTHSALVSTRVVCANTLAVSLGEKGRNRIEVSHRSVFDASAIKRKLGLVDSAWDKFMKSCALMADFQVPEVEATGVLRKVFGAPSTASTLDLSWLGSFGGDSQLVPTGDDEDLRENRNVDRALELWHGAGRGSEHEGSDGTAWGLLNAVTELVDHEMGRTSDTRLDSAWFGRGKDFKAAAFRELAELVES
jgi:phage/plasmid-like protein (TIGR03299 family)